MVHNSSKNSILFTIVLLLLNLGASVSSLAQDNTIPLPGDGTAIPLPGDDSIPLPGEDAEAPADLPFMSNIPQSFDFRGYIENTSTVEYLKEPEEEVLLNAGRVRLNLSGTPEKSLDFGIGLAGTINKGATEVNLIDYMPDEIREHILPDAEAFFVYQMDDEDLFVQEAFGTLDTDRFRLRVGRHKFYTGTGYAFNPIDLFNVKDPLDPTYETDGLDALLFTINLPKQTEIQGLVHYDNHLDTTDYLARVKTYIGGWDLAVQYTHYLKTRVDWEALNTEEAVNDLSQGMSFETFHRDFRWHLVAAEFAGELWEWAIYGEGGYAFIEATGEVGTLDEAAEDHERLLVGLDHTFESQLYVMMEYLRLGQGRTDKTDITLNDRMAYFNGEVLSNNRDTLFSGVSYPLSDLIEGACYAIIGLNDSSVLLNPWLIYDLRPGVTLSLSINLPIGDEESQLGKSGLSGFARLKFHF